MTTAYTAQAIRRLDHHEVKVASAAAAYNPGDVVMNCCGDGRVGIVSALEAVAQGDPVSFYVTGQYDVNCATGTTFSAGDRVYWDDTNNIAKTTATGGYVLIGTAVAAKASGPLTVRVEINRELRCVGGTVTLDGANPTPVTTGLTTVIAAVACMKSTAAPAADPTQITVGYSSGTLNIYAWKITATNDGTLVASTNSAMTVDWIAWGV